VAESRPLTPEPMSVAPREWIPSIGWGIGARWELMVGSIKDAMVDKDVVDPAARRLALRVLGDARGADDMTKARLLYHWVLKNVEDTNEVFGQAAPMLAARTGERHRVLRYLLSLVGVRSSLVLARSMASDQVRSEVADEELYPNLLLVLEPRGARPVFLYLGQRGAPFGYVPAMVRGQEALVLAGDGPRVTIPAGPPDADAHTVDFQVRLRADGSAEAAVVETFRGAGAVSWRGNLEGVPAAVLDQRFDEGYVSRLVPGARLTELSIEGRDEPEAPLVLRYRFDTPALGRRQGNAWVIPSFVPPHMAARYASVAGRTSSQVVAPSIDQKLTVEMELPAGARAARPQAPAHLRGPGGAEVKVRTEQRGQTIVIERELKVPLMRVSPEGYPAWAAFCRGADEAANREVHLTLP
jgi:cellulose synthase operon protein C